MSDKPTGQQSGGRLFRRPSREAEPELENATASASQDAAPQTPKKDRPTPSRRKVEEEDVDSGNIVTRTVSGLLEYLTGVRSEIEKVAWPSREDAQRLTLIVLGSLFISSLALGGIAFLFTQLFTIGLDAPILLFGVMFVAIAGGIIFNRMNARRSSAL